MKEDHDSISTGIPTDIWRDGFTNEEINKLIEELDSGLEIIPNFDFQKISVVHTYKFKDLVYEVDITEFLVILPGKKVIEIKFKSMNNSNAPVSPPSVSTEIMGVLIDSIKEIQPDYITFTADEESRQSLYRRFVQVMSKYASTKYNRIVVNPLTGDSVGNEEFWLEKVL